MSPWDATQARMLSPVSNGRYILKSGGRKKYQSTL
jgi:hypothetical protein